MADTLGQGDEVQSQWARIRAKLRREFGDAAYRSWLRNMTLQGIDAGHAKITVPTRFLRDWVAAHYADRIRALWNAENASVTAIDMLIAGSGNSHVELPEPPPREIAEPTDEKDISAPLDPRFTFENFVVGKPNELAHAASRRVAEAQVGANRSVPFNPLFLYGGVGLGKTHLMHAIAWYIRTHDPKRKVIYLSAEKFMYQFIRALRFKDTMAFKEQFRSVDVLMIDDVQFIAGKDTTQEEFFHTFNTLVDQNRQIVISADKSPTDLEGMEERMRSRLGWGLVADIRSKIALATATPIAMIAPMNDWMFSVVRVAHSATATPATTAGIVSTTASDSRNDWKFAASSRKITTTATARPAEMFVSVSRICATAPRTVTVAPRGGAPARAIASSTCAAARPRSAPATLADSVTMRWPLNRSYSPTIELFSIRATSPRSG